MIGQFGKPLTVNFFFLNFAQDRFLAFSPEQHPIVLQIGGSNLDSIAKATQLAKPYGYDEINLKYVNFLFVITLMLLLCVCVCVCIYILFYCMDLYVPYMYFIIFAVVDVQAQK